MPHGRADAKDDFRQAQRYRDEAALMIAFIRRTSDSRLKADLLELAIRYLDLARSLESAGDAENDGVASFAREGR
jgi:hypothetical protein